MEEISIPWKTVKRHVEQFFAQKDKKFCEDGIMTLPETWQKVVEQNSDTFFNTFLGKNEK